MLRLANHGSFSGDFARAELERALSTALRCRLSNNLAFVRLLVASSISHAERHCDQEPRCDFASPMEPVGETARNR
jgi:hypothetical protein